GNDPARRADGAPGPARRAPAQPVRRAAAQCRHGPYRGARRRLRHPALPAGNFRRMTPALETRDLAIGYRKRPAILGNIDLRAEPGEMVCLLGPNGIGKSTLMRTVARMQPALAGAVFIGGADIVRMSR